MCKYCKKKDVAIYYNDLITVTLDINNELEIKFEDGRDTNTEWIQIEYCPKCGKELYS